VAPAHMCGHAAICVDYWLLTPRVPENQGERPAGWNRLLR